MAQIDEDLIDPFDEPSEDERTAVVHLGDLRRSSLPSEPDRHILVRMDSASVGQVFALDSNEWTLGRHTQSSVVLTDDGVSRKHARVVRDGDRYALEDMGSANGTFLRGNKITRHVLNDGDVFQLGPTVMFRYTHTDASQERMLHKLYEASVRDALTGSYNREHFEERLKVEVAYARRHNTVVSLVMFDLDHFKRVNDTHGHPAHRRCVRPLRGRGICDHPPGHRPRRRPERRRARAFAGRRPVRRFRRQANPGDHERGLLDPERLPRAVDHRAGRHRRSAPLRGETRRARPSRRGRLTTNRA